MVPERQVIAAALRGARDKDEELAIMDYFSRSGVEPSQLEHDDHFKVETAPDGLPAIVEQESPSCGTLELDQEEMQHLLDWITPRRPGADPILRVSAARRRELDDQVRGKLLAKLRGGEDRG